MNVFQAKNILISSIENKANCGRLSGEERLAKITINSFFQEIEVAYKKYMQTKESDPLSPNKYIQKINSLILGGK